LKHPTLGLVRPALLHARSAATQWDDKEDGFNPAFFRVMDEAAKRTPAQLQEWLTTPVPQLNATGAESSGPDMINFSDQNEGDSTELPSWTSKTPNDRMCQGSGH
jgi:hypothetical protein